MTTANPRKGSKGLQETTAFIATFPVPDDIGYERVLSTADFDNWADQNNFYTQQCEQATLLDARNRLRKKINVTAASPAWKAQGEKPFEVMVHDFGKSYAVRRVEDAFALRAKRLPRQVKQYIGTKREAIDALVASMALAKLPLEWQVRVLAHQRDLGRYGRTVEHLTSEVERENNAIYEQIKLMAEKGLFPKDDPLGLMFRNGKDDDDEGGDAGENA